MSRELYRKSIAPHNARVAADSGTPVDNVQAAELLVRDNLELGSDLKLFISPELTGYKSRVSAPYKFASKVYSNNSPQQEYGPELIVNGSFSSQSSWEIAGESTISNGQARLYSSTGASTTLIQRNLKIIGRVYKIEFDIIGSASGSWSVGEIEVAYNGSYSGHKIAIFTSNSVDLTLKRQEICDATIDNISLCEVLNSDLSQTTANSQPYLDKIAPTEQLSIKNNNVDTRFLSFSTISFSATDKWTLEMNLMWNGNSAQYQSIIGSTNSSIRFVNNYAYQFSFVNESAEVGVLNYNLSSSVGKRIRLHFVAKGDGKLNLYVNGVFINYATIATNFSFNSLFKGRTNYEYCSVYHVAIFSQAFTDSLITYRSELLKSIFPEIPAVQIGTQTWAVRNFEAVCTPQGNLIQNVTDNATWATSQTLYDNAYASQSGTVEQKTYAGVKAAAMWCHYNNDVAVGSIYGKLYNWFAVKLLQMDIDYYNAANPTTPLGWKVPTETDFTTLSAYLGGNSASGGKLKMAGLDFWTTPNTGADNFTGFSALGSGYRDAANGNFFANKTGSWMWTQTNVSSTSSKLSLFYYNNGSMSVDINLNKYGAALRLIKA